MPKVKRLAASTGAMPTQPRSIPSPAEVRPLNILPLEIASTMVIATKHREKYSHGPMAKATSAIFWLRSAAKRALKNVPKKEATIPMARALPAFPLWAMG